MYSTFKNTCIAVTAFLFLAGCKTGVNEAVSSETTDPGEQTIELSFGSVANPTTLAPGESITFSVYYQGKALELSGCGVETSEGAAFSGDEGGTTTSTDTECTYTAPSAIPSASVSKSVQKATTTFELNVVATIADADPTLEATLGIVLSENVEEAVAPCWDGPSCQALFSGDECMNVIEDDPESTFDYDTLMAILLEMGATEEQIVEAMVCYSEAYPETRDCAVGTEINESGCFGGDEGYDESVMAALTETFAATEANGHLWIAAADSDLHVTVYKNGIGHNDNGVLINVEGTDYMDIDHNDWDERRGMVIDPSECNDLGGSCVIDDLQVKFAPGSSDEDSNIIVLITLRSTSSEQTALFAGSIKVGSFTDSSSPTVATATKISGADNVKEGRMSKNNAWAIPPGGQAVYIAYIIKNSQTVKEAECYVNDEVVSCDDPSVAMTLDGNATSVDISHDLPACGACGDITEVYVAAAEASRIYITKKIGDGAWDAKTLVKDSLLHNDTRIRLSSSFYWPSGSTFDQLVGSRRVDVIAFTDLDNATTDLGAPYYEFWMFTALETNGAWLGWGSGDGGFTFSSGHYISTHKGVGSKSTLGDYEIITTPSNFEVIGGDMGACTSSDPDNCHRNDLAIFYTGKYPTSDNVSGLMLFCAWGDSNNYLDTSLFESATPPVVDEQYMCEGNGMIGQLDHDVSHPNMVIERDSNYWLAFINDPENGIFFLGAPDPANITGDFLTDFPNWYRPQ